MHDESQQWKFIKPAATENVLNQLEQHFKVALPLAYRQFAKKHNGARPTNKTIKLPDGREQVVKAFLTVYPTKGGVKKVDDWLKGQLPKKSVPFANDPFGNYYFFAYLDTNPSEEPAVYLWNHELQQEEFIALVFDDFLAKLIQ